MRLGRPNHTRSKRLIGRSLNGEAITSRESDIFRWLTERLQRFEVEFAKSGLTGRLSEELLHKINEYTILQRELAKAVIPCGFCGLDRDLPHTHSEVSKHDK